MFNVYGKIKESYSTWNLKKLKKKLELMLNSELTSFPHVTRFQRRKANSYTLTLDSFIKHCQQKPTQTITFPQQGKEIDVSIIIPVYNQWQLTCTCINSILETCKEGVNYELILADDCSTDETVDAATTYPGLIVIKTEVNSGFLQNCNHAAQKARGRYILLLNNDTVVLPNWLEHLYKTITADDHIAIVGSKVLYPTGIVQEAGSVIFNNGSAASVGQECGRDWFYLNTQRETDYLSGCSILIRKTFWDSVGGFDPRYRNAYYEDTDLAMAARAQGMRVVYQPKSELVHFLHKTYVEKHQQLLEQNKLLFVQKWENVLKNHSEFDTSWHLAMARAEQTLSPAGHHRRASKRLNILFYSPIPTYPSNHGNRARIVNLIKKFEEMGHKVHFVMLENGEYNKHELKAMKNQFSSFDIIPCKKSMVSLGAVAYDGWYEEGIGEQIHFLCKHYDIDLIVCSYIYQSKLLEFVPHHILKVIDTHDKMGNRTEMLTQNEIPIKQFSCTIEEEGAYLRRADLVLGITEEESRYFEKVSGKKNTLMISHVEKPKFVQKTFEYLSHVGIVASNNPFNLAMVQKFLERISHSSQAKNGLPFTIHIAGGVKDAVAKKIFDPKMKVFKKPWVTLHGFVTNITEFYSQMDLIVSPMMCGTGINIKTVEAMAHGMPLLTTVHGGRGVNLDDKMHTHIDIDSLVHSLLAMKENPAVELQRLAALSCEKYLNFYEKNERNCQLLFEHHKVRVPQL